MQPLLRIILGAITATLFVSSIAFAMGPPIIDQTSADVLSPASQADPTLEAADNTSQTRVPGTSNQDPLTSDEKAAAGSDTTKQRASDANTSGESTSSTSNSYRTPSKPIKKSDANPTSTTTSTTTSTSTRRPSTTPTTSTTTTSTTSTTTTSTKRPSTTPTTSTTTSTTTVSLEADVVVRPGDDVERLVGKAPVGTVFLFKPGRYEGVSIRPKDGMVFVAEPGVVFDGLDDVAYAFVGNGVDVTVRGFVVERYASELQQSAIKGATGWTIEDNEVRYNRSSGIASAGGSIIRNNFVHRNGQIGVKGTGTGLVVEGNEIAYNNVDGHPWKTATAGAGGTKFWSTTDLVVKNNYVHDNDGPGLWVDGSNRNVLINGNRVEANNGPGIFYEISYAGVISDNKVYRNRYVGIWISASSDVEVKNNKVVDNLYGGIGATQSDRGNSFNVENLWVHDNYIQMVTPNDGFWGWNGLQQYVEDDTYFTTRNNRWDNNTYSIPTGLDRPFTWMNGRRTIKQWQDYDQDTNATFNIS